MFLFSFFSSRWRTLDEGKLLQYFWDTLYAQCTFRYGRGIGLEIRSRFESRSKIESVIALHRWRGRRRKGLRSKRHVFERIPGLLRTLYLYVREDPPPVCRDPRRHFVPDTEIMGGNSASLRNVQVGGGGGINGSVINRVMGVCGSAVHHARQSCFRSNLSTSYLLSYLLPLNFVYQNSRRL